MLSGLLARQVEEQDLARSGLEDRGDWVSSTRTPTVTLAGEGGERRLATHEAHKLGEVEVLVLVRRSQFQQVGVSASTQIRL